jgi:hypothetical protein
VPYGYWLLGLTASRYDYHQTVAGLNQSYIYSGRSESGEAHLAYRRGTGMRSSLPAGSGTARRWCRWTASPSGAATPCAASTAS